MSLYALALFIHVLGAMSIGVSVATEVIALNGLRRASTADQAKASLRLMPLVRAFGAGGAIPLLITGIYMASASWGGSVWPMVALLVVLAMLPAGFIGARRLAPTAQEVMAAQGPLSPEISEKLRDRLLWTSVQVRSGLVVGLVFLMTVKPDVAGSLGAILVFAILGLIGSLRPPRPLPAA